MSSKPNTTSSATGATTPVTMPKLGESVTEGTLGSWLKQIGDRVEKYEPLVEVQTDKVTAEIPSPIAGVIVEIIGEEGRTLAVGAPICVIDTSDGSAAGATGGDLQTPASADAAANAEQEMPSIDDVPTSDAATQGQGQAQVQVQAQPSSNGVRAAREERDEISLLRARSSPLVRRLAEEHDIDLQALSGSGSGIGGRVTRDDMLAEIERRQQGQEQEQAVSAPQQTSATQAPQSAPPAFHDQVADLASSSSAQAVSASAPAGFAAPAVSSQQQHFSPSAPQPPASVELLPGDRVIEAPFLRRQTADAVTRSAFTAPHVTVWMEADMSRVAAARERLRNSYREREGTSLTWLPFVAHAVVVALREHPAMNSAWDNGRIVQRQAINLGLAIGLDDGLVVPVLHNADELSLTGFARRATQLADRARAGRLQPDDVRGGTFTLNNPGTLGSLFSTPIIVQPQAGILSMEAIQKRVVVVDDSIAIRPMMNLSLSVDHRLVDGLGATRFLARVKQALEQWTSEDDK